MSDQFYDIAQKLDELKKSEVPSKTELDRLAELITGPEYSRYFFHDFNLPEPDENFYSVNKISSQPAPYN